MAEDCAIAASEYRGQPPPFLTEIWVPDRVDRAVNAVQAAGGDPAVDTGWGNSRHSQLGGRNNAVLPPS
jgi:hypothetical protein